MLQAILNPATGSPFWDRLYLGALENPAGFGVNRDPGAPPGSAPLPPGEHGNVRPTRAFSVSDFATCQARPVRLWSRGSGWYESQALHTLWSLYRWL